MEYRNVRWKRNLRKLPELIRQKLQTIGDQPVSVGVRLSVSRKDIEENIFSHLGISLLEGEISLRDTTVIPPIDMGRWSKANVEGDEIVRRDLPMITRTYSTEVPNWGDWYNGSHTIDWDREVYQRDLIPPKEIALRLEVLAYDPVKDTYIIRVSSEEILNPSDPSFEDDLFYNLNLLQENVGYVDVFPANATREDYLATLTVTWEILPPGEREQNIAIIVGSSRPLSPEVKAMLVERYRFLETLRPRNFVAGSSGFRRYFGAQFTDDLVIFENVEYGNAVYIMGRNWGELSRLSRTELLAMAQRDFERVPHIGDWKEKVRSIIRRRTLPEAA